MKHSIAICAALTLTLPACVLDDPPPAAAQVDSSLEPTNHPSGPQGAGKAPELRTFAGATAEAGTTVTLASGQQGIVGMTVHAGTVYWSTNGTNSNGSIFSCALSGCGGQPATLAAGTGRSLVADSQNLYWRSGTNVYATTLAGGVTSTFASAHKVLQTLAVNSTHLFWGSGNQTGDVMKCALAACTNKTALAQDQYEPAGIATDSVNLYWTTFASGTVVSEPLSGGTATTLASSFNSGAEGVAVDAQNVYWTNYNQGTVTKCAIAGCGGQPTVLASGQADPIAIAIDSTDAYFVNNNVSGSLVKVPLAGGALQTLASGQVYPTGVVLTPHEVVWASATAVLKMSR